MQFLTAATSPDVAQRAADVAVLPVGSFEQHGDHLPLTTDTMIAAILAQRVSEAYSLFLLPPITISCSHEHAAFRGTVSLSATTLLRVIEDVLDSLRTQGVHQLVIITGHGGNYALNNLAQQINATGPRILVFPTGQDWDAARSKAGLATTAHDDMHGGEGETSILLKYAPEVVRASWDTADHSAPDRPDLLLLGMDEYTKSGIIGQPSLASAEKGAALIEQLVRDVERPLRRLRRADS